MIRESFHSLLQAQVRSWICLKLYTLIRRFHQAFLNIYWVKTLNKHCCGLFISINWLIFRIAKHRYSVPIIHFALQVHEFSVCWNQDCGRFIWWSGSGYPDCIFWYSSIACSDRVCMFRGCAHTCNIQSKNNETYRRDIPNPIVVTDRAQPMLDKVLYCTCSTSGMQTDLLRCTAVI